jgi:hypothetical protein
MPSKICRQGFEASRVIVSVARCKIAGPAEQTTDSLPRDRSVGQFHRMVMIDAQRVAIGWRTPAAETNSLLHKQKGRVLC